MSLDRDALSLLAWNQLWQVTLAALVLGIAARVLGRKHPHLAYTLWMLVLVKALVPPILSSPTGIFSWASAAQARIALPEQTVLARPLAFPKGARLCRHAVSRPGNTRGDFGRESKHADHNRLRSRFPRTRLATRRGGRAPASCPRSGSSLMVFCARARAQRQTSRRSPRLSLGS